MIHTLDNSGSRRAFKTSSALIWIAVPVTALLYALAWNQLPQRCTAK